MTGNRAVALSFRAFPAEITFYAELSKRFSRRPPGCLSLGRCGLRPLRLLCGGGLRLAGRFDRIEPWLRRLLAGGASLRIELVDDIVKFKISLPGGPGDQMPLGRFGEIARRAAAARQNARQPVLGDRAAAHRRLAEQCGRRGLIARDAVAIIK